MKVGAGGLQAHATYDDVAELQAQETRRQDYHQRPEREAELPAPLNRDALNKTVEKTNETTQAFDLPLRPSGEKTKGSTVDRYA